MSLECRIFAFQGHFIMRRKKGIKKKVAKPRKSEVPKTRASGTLTEAAFWGMIKSCLRRASRWWKPIANVRLKARRNYKGPLKRLKYEYQCNVCKDWFPATQIQIDHILPVGSLNKAEDLPGVVERLFCEEDNLQAICSSCHTSKSLLDNALIKENKKKK